MNPGPVKVVGRTVDKQPHPPSLKAPLGTLPGQVSVFHTLVWGTRSALVFGFSTAFFTAIIGMFIGASSAYFGGFINDVMMRITDAFLAFPLIAGVVLIQQVITITLVEINVYVPISGQIILINQPDNPPFWLRYLQEIDPLMVAFILFAWTPFARIMNTVVLTIKQAEYVEAARALGASHSRIISRHLIPNSVAPIIVLAARDVGGMVLLQATFTFIGMGGDSLWGNLLVGGRDWIIGPGGSILTYWWLFLPATLALMLFGVGWNMAGDLLNDVLNPRTS
jgi:peptide/nickel transport system permease protein